MTSDEAGHLPRLSVVLPMYRTRTFLDELLERLAAACPDDTELVIVDDACPQHSADALAVRSLPFPTRLIRLDRNVGQHAAVLIALAHVQGRFVCTMDADLQDAPEDVPRLLAALEAAPPEVAAVAAGRLGDYQRWSRRLTATLYRRVRAALSRGRIPPDAGMFQVARREALITMLQRTDPVAPLTSAMAAAGLHIGSVPVERMARADGRSSYSAPRRARVAVRSLATVLPSYPATRSWRRRRWQQPGIAIDELAAGPRPENDRPATAPTGEAEVGS